MRPIFPLLALALLASCTNTISMSGAKAAIPEARVVAEKDLDCPQQQIHIEEQLGGRLLASGCGRKALYHAQCVALQCTVRSEDDRSIPFRDRPDPGSPLLP